MIKYLLLLALVPLVALGAYQASASNWDQIPVEVRQSGFKTGEGIGLSTSEPTGNVSLPPAVYAQMNSINKQVKPDQKVCGDKLCDGGFALSTINGLGNVSIEPQLYKQMNSINHQINPNQVVCGDHLCAAGEHYILGK